MNEQLNEKRLKANQEKLIKLQNTLDKFIKKLEKIIDTYKKDVDLHYILPVDVFANFDTETYYSWGKEQNIKKEIGAIIIFMHNIDATKQYKSVYDKVQYGTKEYTDLSKVQEYLYKANECADSIVNKREAIAEVKRLIEKYNNNAEAEKNSKRSIEQLFNEVPELKQFIEECGERQYKYLVEYNEKLRKQWEAYYKADRELCDLWNTGKHEEYRSKEKEVRKMKPKHYYSSQEQIKNEVEMWKTNEGKLMAERIKTEFGEVKSTSLSLGADGNVNGYIVGTNKTAKIETIFAGGYNIQCLHTRFLVHEK